MILKNISAGPLFVSTLGKVGTTFAAGESKTYADSYREDTVVTALITAGKLQVTSYDSSAGSVLTQEEAQLERINAQADSYTLVLADAGKVIDMAKATSQTLTVPPNASVAFPIGTTIKVIQSGAGACTIAAGAGVTIDKPADYSLVMAERYAQVYLCKMATNTWRLTGDLQLAQAVTHYAAAAPTLTGHIAGIDTVMPFSEMLASPVVITDETPVALTGLSVTLGAARKYKFRIVLLTETATAADGVEFDLDGGAATMTAIRASYLITDATPAIIANTQVTALATDVGATAATGLTKTVIEGGCTVNAGGTFIPRAFKFDNAAGANLTVYAHSFIEVQDVT